MRGRTGSLSRSASVVGMKFGIHAPPSPGRASRTAADAVTENAHGSMQDEHVYAATLFNMHYIGGT